MIAKITLVIGFIAASHAIFLSIQLFSLNQKTTNRLLGLLLLLLSVRIGKSLFAISIPNSLSVFLAIGLVGMSAIGPLLFLYAMATLDTKFKVKTLHYIHFVPVFFLTFILSIHLTKQILFAGYCFVNVQLFGYLGFSCWRVFKNDEARSDDVTFRWLKLLLGGFALISVSFVAQLFMDNEFLYLAAVLIALFILYSLTLIARNYSKVFLPVSGKNGISLRHHGLAKKIEVLMSEGEAFKDPSLTLSTMAARLNVPHYVISQTINLYFNKSFPELVTHYRLIQAERLLSQRENDNLTIEAIAYESGFSTLSAFYTSFKKSSGLTPAQFKSRSKAMNPNSESSRPNFR